MVIEVRYDCAHCGATDVGSYSAGYASVGDQYLCHPNDEGRPDCYTLVTVFKHPMPCPGCLRPAWKGMLRES